jgi:glutaredoxin
MDLNLPGVFIKIPNGACPYCGRTVRILESELNEIVLNSDGTAKTIDNISYSCIGYCCSCNNPVYIDPTGLNYKTIPFNEHAIELHNKIKQIIGDNQTVSRSDVPITLSISHSEFVKK